VYLEEEPLVPERDGACQRGAHAIVSLACRRVESRCGAEAATRVCAHTVGMWTVYVEQHAVGLDEVEGGEPLAQSFRGGVVDGGGEPGERRTRAGIVQAGDHEMRERISQRQGKPRSLRGGHEREPVLPRGPVVSHVYTGRVRISHHELDAFGRVYPAAYLRHLAVVAVDASTEAGFDARWYESAGVHWLVRRTTFTLHAPATAGIELVVRTWVEDFRRVRSQRRYEVRKADGAPILDAVTDWVLVESASGKLRRIPDEVERGFGTAPSPVSPRGPWSAPPAAASAVRATYPVRYTDLDALMHVNNAAYMDVLFQAALDALGSVGWGLEALVASGAVPLCVTGDIEYLDAARFGDELTVATWFTPSSDALDVHQVLARVSDGRDLVRCTVRWAWRNPLTRAVVATPSGLADAVAHAVAA